MVLLFLGHFIIYVLLFLIIYNIIPDHFFFIFSFFHLQGTQTNTVFTESADLSKLSSDKLYLDDVVQQAGIRVCVEGSSSYSLTSMSYHDKNADPNRLHRNDRRRVIVNGLPNVSGSAFTSQRVIKESVVVDRPFAYALYNVANGIVYAAGKLERPIWEETDDGSDGSDIETIKI